jgi:hypothetical protein
VDILAASDASFVDPWRRLVEWLRPAQHDAGG